MVDVGYWHTPGETPQNIPLNKAPLPPVKPLVQPVAAPVSAPVSAAAAPAQTPGAPMGNIWGFLANLFGGAPSGPAQGMRGLLQQPTGRGAPGVNSLGNPVNRF